MKHLIYIFSLLLLSCNYLDKDPDASLNVPLDSEEKIAELLTGAYPDASYFPFLETRTDNVAERENGVHTRLNEAMYRWEDEDQEDLDAPLFYWNSCYRGIAQANKALELLARYPKTERVKALYGEAFLLRAYLHFMLVNIWAEPYKGEASKNDMGIPYLTTPEKNALVEYNRGELIKRLLKEFLLGLINGGTIAGIVILVSHFAFKAEYLVSITVAIALITVIVNATGPFITTSNDVLGILIYFFIAKMILGF